MKKVFAVIILTVSISGFADTQASSGAECIKLLTSRMNIVTNKAISSASKCRNQYSVSAMNALTRLDTISDSAVSTASRIETEEGASCFKALCKFEYVSNKALKSCLKL